jgi:hypothetical protein
MHALVVAAVMLVLCTDSTCSSTLCTSAANTLTAACTNITAGLLGGYHIVQTGMTGMRFEHDDAAIAAAQELQQKYASSQYRAAISGRHVQLLPVAGGTLDADTARKAGWALQLARGREMQQLAAALAASVAQRQAAALAASVALRQAVESGACYN